MIRRLLVYGISVIAVLSILVPATPVHADAPCSPPNFLGMPAWYRGLQKQDDCATIRSDLETQTILLTIGLNILQAAMVVVAYVAIGFIIKGGYMYMVSTGSPDAMARAKNTVRDALIGLVIAITAAMVVNTIAGIL
ncbi:hypothetical protein HG437_003240 [Candidatus Saccharibacteria bacterium]|nr:hypothetical protein [Candidatus Saccharibacteria bacterium]